MTRAVIVHRDVEEDGQATFRRFLWCPGCEDVHAIGPAWDWDGDTELPTISPSILVVGVQWPTENPWHKPQHQVSAGAQITCHSFIRQGRWEFLGDSTHVLAGQTVPAVPVPLDAKGVL